MFDEVTWVFIVGLLFVLVVMVDVGGCCDVLFCGGVFGFVYVLDEYCLFLFDLNGNNLFDSFCNVVVNFWVGLLFVLFGRDEILRVEGWVWVSVVDELFDCFIEVRCFVSVLVVEVMMVFIYCVKSFWCGWVWDVVSWFELVVLSVLELLVCYLGMSEFFDLVVMEWGYVVDLVVDVLVGLVGSV